MYKLKTDKIISIYPDSWPSWASVSVDDCTYTDSGWNGCDYRIADEYSNCDGLAVDIHITGRKSVWNGTTFETRARIVFVGDGSPDTHTKGKIYSTEPLTGGNR